MEISEFNWWNSILLPAFSGAATFLLSRAVVNQLTSFYVLKQEVHIELIDTGNVWSVGDDAERFRTAIGNLRRLSARVTALELSLTWPSRIFITLRGYRLKEAGEKLMLYQGLVVRSEDAERPLVRVEIEECLRLPLSTTPAAIEGYRNIRRQRLGGGNI